MTSVRESIEDWR